MVSRLKITRYTTPPRWLNVYPEIKKRIPFGEAFLWPPPSSVDRIRNELLALLPEHDVDHIFDGTDGWARTDRLRQKFKAAFQAVSLDHAIEMSRWIVTRWGGIDDKTDQIPVWVKEWEGFDRGWVHDFVNRMGDDRIASWSKILSFAFPERYPVFDARNGVALNCIFAEIGFPRRFPMTATQNSTAKATERFLRTNRWKPVDLTYHDYIVLLDLYARDAFQGSLMSAEMTLFANSVKIMQGYMATQSQQLKDDLGYDR